MVLIAAVAVQRGWCWWVCSNVSVIDSPAAAAAAAAALQRWRSLRRPVTRWTANLRSPAGSRCSAVRQRGARLRSLWSSFTTRPKSQVPLTPSWWPDTCWCSRRASFLRWEDGVYWKTLWPEIMQVKDEVTACVCVCVCALRTVSWRPVTCLWVGDLQLDSISCITLILCVRTVWSCWWLCVWAPSSSLMVSLLKNVHKRSSFWKEAEKKIFWWTF